MKNGEQVRIPKSCIQAHVSKNKTNDKRLSKVQDHHYLVAATRHFQLLMLAFENEDT